jgi:hypothetical protein
MKPISIKITKMDTADRPYHIYFYPQTIIILIRPT